MAQPIKSLSLGSKIKDTKGNVFVVVAHNHYSSNQVTLMHTNLNKSMSMNKTVTTEHYGLSEVHYYLNNSYLNTLQEEVKNNDGSLSENKLNELCAFYENLMSLNYLAKVDKIVKEKNRKISVFVHHSCRVHAKKYDKTNRRSTKNI